MIDDVKGKNIFARHKAGFNNASTMEFETLTARNVLQRLKVIAAQDK